MRPLTWIPRLVGAVWRFSRRSWIDTGTGLRPGSAASGLYLFLFLIFFLVGLALLLLGFDLGEVDRWIAAQAGWLDAVASFLFRAGCAVVMLICAVTVWGAAFDRGDEERPGIGCALAAIVVAYFAWFGIVGD
jgi:uncharacterized membrane protein (UPF0182 family)